MKTHPFISRTVLAIALTAALAGCAADRLHSDGMSLIEEGKYEEGINKLSQARLSDPGNGNYKKDWLLQRDRVVLRILNEANQDRTEQRWDSALRRYARALNLDPGNVAAQQAISDINVERRQAARVDEAALAYGKGDLEQASNIINRVLVENPTQARALAVRSQITEATAQNNSLNGINLNLKGKKPVTLQFREANLRMVMEAIAKTTGLNVMFDKDVKSDLKVTIFVRDTPVDEAIDLILMQTQTTKRVMGENSILVYPDTDAKAREYAELKIRRFSLVNADPKNVMAMIKTMTKTKDMFIDEKTNALVVRDTPQIIRMIEKLVVSMDQPEPEVMLEVDVMEVSRDRMLALGINLPTSFGVSTPAMTLDAFRNMSDANVTVSALAAGITAQKTDSDINDLATPRIRVRNKEKAKFLVGDRLPVISTAAVPSTTAVSAVYNTSVQYVEVGIKIEVEPTIYADGEVAIRLLLEVSSNSGQNAQAAQTGTIAYTISTRSVSTVLRLKDGQTEILGGLIQDQDRSAANKIPGFGDIPLLGRLFGVQTDTKNKKEIIMSITPRIIRNNRQIDSDLLEMWSGTETNMRYGTRQAGNPKVQLASAQPAAIAAPAKPAVVAKQPPAPAPAPAPTLLPAPAAKASPAVQQAAPAAASATAVRPMVLSAPGNAKAGEVISVRLAMPPLGNASQVESSLSYDSSRLRLVSVSEADAPRNATSGARFYSEGDTPGSVRLSLTAGRGEILPAAGAELAVLEFEALPVAGTTQLSLGASTVQSADGGSTSLPDTPAVELDVSTAP